jgi:hypothetical protein
MCYIGTTGAGRPPGASAGPRVPGGAEFRGKWHCN